MYKRQVVDDAIVVGEHADFRARTLGESPVVAAENAASRMAPPVFSATITTILAFWGLTLIGGRFGSLLSDIPFTVIAVLAAALVECFLILPNHMSHSLTVNGTVKWYDIPSYHFNRGFNWFKKNIFRKIIKFVLIFRYPVFAFAVLLLMLNVALFTSGQVNFRFFNAPERGSLSGNIAMLDGASRSDTKAMVDELQRAVNDTAKAFEEKYGTNPVTFSMTEIGGNTGRGISGIANKDNDLKGSVAIELIDADARPYSYFAYIGELQDAIQKHPLLETISFRGWGFGPGGDSLDVQLIGTDSYILKEAAEKLKTDISLRFPEVTSVEDDLPYGKEELILELTAQYEGMSNSCESGNDDDACNDIPAECYRSSTGQCHDWRVGHGLTNTDKAVALARTLQLMRDQNVDGIVDHPEYTVWDAFEIYTSLMTVETIPVDTDRVRHSWKGDWNHFNNGASGAVYYTEDSHYVWIPNGTNNLMAYFTPTEVDLETAQIGSLQMEIDLAEDGSNDAQGAGTRVSDTWIYDLDVGPEHWNTWAHFDITGQAASFLGVFEDPEFFEASIPYTVDVALTLDLSSPVDITIPQRPDFYSDLDPTTPSDAWDESYSCLLYTSALPTKA